jgi:hypothetical protein
VWPSLGGKEAGEGRLWVMSRNTQSEHSESAFPPKADVRADIA